MFYYLIKSYFFEKSFHQIKRVMKFSLILLFVVLFNAMAASVYGQKETFRINMKNVIVREVLKEVESKTTYRFFFSDNFADIYKIVSIDMESDDVTELLGQLFQKSTVTFKILDNNVVVITPVKTERQGIPISGTVNDDTGEPLPGVNVVIKGTQQGTVTDANGFYSLQAPDNNATLVFTFLGYATQEFLVGDQRAINVTLTEAIRELEEVVVIGYGTAKRRDLTGATGRLNASEIQNKPSNNVMDFLRGTVAGFNSNMSVSAKGGGSMEIRGTTSLKASNDPLIVVDGVIYIGEIADINPADIESIDILKDGSAAAVYGTRAAAGVLAITTKRGVSEKPVIDFNASWGVSTLTKRQEIYSPEEYIIVRGDAMRSRYAFSRPEYCYRNPNELPSGVTLDMWLDGDAGDPMTIWMQNRLNLGPTEMKNFPAGKTINWYDEVFQTGLRQDYNIGIGGKTQMTNYYFSLGYLNNQGIVVGDKYQNVRSRLNLSMDVTNWLQIGTNLQFAARDQSTNPASWEGAVRSSPYGDKYEEDGTWKYYPHDDNMASNPFSDYAADLMDKNTNIVANLFANIQLPLGIKYQLVFNNRFSFGNTYRFYGVDTWRGRPVLTGDGDLLGGSASRDENKRFSWQVDNIFSWNKTIADIHRIEATLLINAEKNQSWVTTASSSQFAPSDALGFHNLQVGMASSFAVSAGDTYATGNAVMGRINYTLMDKYLLTASYRRDGFSAFGQSHPYAYFPAVAVAWRLSEESFMNGTNNWLDHLKIRLSWGVNGNRDIGIYSALSEIGVYRTIVGGNSVTGITSTTLANSDLRWERTTAYNAGIDFSIFKNVLTGSIDGYMMSTKDLLMTRALPSIVGYTSVMANLGEITNKGM